MKSVAYRARSVRYLVILTLIGIVMFLSASTTKPSRATIEDAAWLHAKLLANATQEEIILWQQPPVIYSPTVRLDPARSSGCNEGPGQVCVIRVCGETQLFMILDADDRSKVKLGSLVIIFLILPEEDALLPNLLTHEFLHTIWGHRITRIAGYYDAHPNSEAWVRNLIDTNCPTL